jgi:hypothetical protein
MIQHQTGEKIPIRDGGEAEATLIVMSRQLDAFRDTIQ